MSAEERRTARYEQLLEAGIRIIGTQGYEAATLRAVCKEAGLTERYFYESFKNRLALFEAAYSRINQELLLDIQRAVTSAGTVPRVVTHAVLDAVFNFILDAPDRGRLIMIEPMGAFSSADNPTGQNIDTFVEFVLSMAKGFIKEEALPDSELRVLARGGVGAVIYLCQQWIMTDLEQPIDELIRGSRLLFDGISQQIGIPGP